ncbi:MCE family protein [Nocardia halotolerans]|uniref:MCE family protein n=1 Tax=Nocardia halotolerans TaxID=1755878 RepID=A0ABV8VCR3_9NOCA
MTLRTTLAATLCAAAVAVSSSGCSMTVAQLPMPEPGIGGPGYTLHATFRDALNLPDRAHVKIGGTDIGVVTDISTTAFLADVEMLIREDIELPQGTTVELRQATPLGDIFVAITLPSAATAGPPLAEGARIGTEHTASAASVEQLMMSVSMLINGGGINQAAEITSELDSIFAGKAPQLRHLIGEMTSVITALNERTGDLDATLSGLSVLTGELAGRKAELGAAADSFPQLVGLFAENNRAIVDLINRVAVTMDALGDFSATNGPQFVSLFQSIQDLMSGFVQMDDDLSGALDGFHQIYPSVMDSMRGPNLSVGAILSYLDIGAVTDPSGSRWPDGTDVPAFIGSLAQVIAKVTGRLNSTPQQPPQEGPR